jgi:serine/threonine protein kinase
MSPLASRVTLAKIADYQILRVLGNGSGSVVYHGEHCVTGEPAAIKVMTGRVMADRVLRLRFAQECRVARKLDHPHIVRVLDFGLDGNKPYLVMEYVDGGSLGQRLEKEGRLGEDEAVNIITQVGQALHWAHQRRLVHRDVKADNILLGSDGRAKLSDLGLVKQLDDDAHLTMPLDYLGTPHFMAPEQFRNSRDADALCDLYSLAATLYQTVTGELPFRARSSRDLAAIYQKKLDLDLAPPCRLVPELSQRVNDAILRALQVDRNQRHGSVAEFLDCLTEEKSSKPVAAPARGATARNGERTTMRDQRVKKRYPSQRSSVCETLQSLLDPIWSAQVVDISETGLCLESTRRFERGVMLQIVLEEGEVVRRSLVASVVWVKRLKGNTWKVGCRFAQPLSEGEMQQLR